MIVREYAMRHNHTTRRGITLIESVVSLVIISVLMLGLSGSVMLGVRAMPSSTELGAVDREVQDICNQIRQDFANASEITYQKSGNTVRTVLAMIPTGATGEAGTVTYDFIGDAGMIRRRTDANAYVVLTSSMSRYAFSRSETDGLVDFVTIKLEFDDTIQGVFELFIRTPYKPEIV